MTKNILIKPIVSEKSENVAQTENRYSFVVDIKANKLQVKEAVEKMYGVAVVSVNTAIMPAKMKMRNTKSGFIRGKKSAYKKATVRVAEGDVIDFFDEF